MRIATVNRMLWSLTSLLAAATCLTQTGCISYAIHAVPAARLPDIYKAESKCKTVPVNLTLLRQEPPMEHIIGPGDTLGIYVPGIIAAPAGTEGAPGRSPIISSPTVLTQRDYYPPRGVPIVPNAGTPVLVAGDGTILISKLKPIDMRGRTLSEAAELIRQAYIDSGLLNADTAEAQVTLIRPRVHRVLVLREDIGDASQTPQQLQRERLPFYQKGTGNVIDFPTYENDVLHVLAATGGLPGIETFNHVWVLKSRSVRGAQDEVRLRLEAGNNAQQVFQALNAQRTAIRIPLRVLPGEPLPFGPQDVILEDGDVVYLEPRTQDFFYTGGLLPGGQVPLPRDRDIDILEAIALSNGSLGGIGGILGNGIRTNSGNIGNILPPTRAIVLRKLPNGQQLQIRCDLEHAKNSMTERILIQPGDYVMLYYKPGELAGNVVLNAFNLNMTFLTSLQN